MPLNNEQKRIIKTTLRHILVFPKDPTKFKKKECELNNALTKPSIIINKYNYYWLRECLFNPTAHFQSIESMQRDSIFVGEVQDYILKYITKRLKKTGNKLQYWNETALKETLPTANWTTPFISQVMAVEGEAPWQHSLSILEEKIYTQELKVGYPYSRKYSILITVTFEPKKTRTKLVKLPGFSASHCDTDDDEDAYTENFLIEGEKQAEKAAAHLAINHLKIKHELALQDIQKALQSNTINAIVTNKYYFDLLKSKQLKLSDIDSLTEQECINLCSTFAISLQKKNIFTFKQVKQLSFDQRRIIIIPYFYSLLEKKILNYEDISSLCKNRIQFLINPRVFNLMQANKITFKQATSVPLYLQNIVCSPLYSAFFMNNPIDWKKFNQINPTLSHLLLKPPIAHAITNNHLMLNTAILVMYTFENPLDSLYKMYLIAFCSRLEKFYLKTERIHSDINIIPTWMTELATAAKECKVDIFAMKEIILSIFLKTVKEKLAKKILVIDKNDPEHMIYQTLIKIIAAGNFNKPTWTHTLNNIIQIANEFKSIQYKQEYLVAKKITALHESKHSLFTPTRTTKDKYLANLCENLTYFCPLCLNENQKTAPYRYKAR